MNIVEMLYDQYGDNGPEQDQISKLGKTLYRQGMAEVGFHQDGHDSRGRSKPGSPQK